MKQIALRVLAVVIASTVSTGSLAALALAAPALSAQEAKQPARWLEVRTPNFVIFSDASQERARTVARELERVRATLGRALGEDDADAGPGANGRSPRPRRPPIVVFAVDGEASLQELLPQYWEQRGNRPVAAFAESAYARYIVLRVDAPARERFRRALHEYVHLLIHATIEDVPAWLDEGVSELWATARVFDDAVEVGRPETRHLRLLRASNAWIPLAELLAAEGPPGMAEPRRQSLFYSQAWALAHFLALGGPTPALGLASLTPDAPLEYVRRLEEDDVDAAADVAGPSEPLERLERALAAYVREGRFRSVRIPTPREEAADSGEADGNLPRGDEPAASVRLLSAAEALAARAAFLLNGVRPSAAGPLLTEALRLDPDDPGVLETLGHFYFQQNEPAEAAAFFDRAIASGTTSHLPYFYRALLSGPVPGPTGPLGEAAFRERLLRRAIALDPEFAPAYARLADVYAGFDWSLEVALPLIVKATELEADNGAYWVSLGRLLVRLERPGEAREAGLRGLARVRSPRSRELVEAFLAGLDPGRLPR